MTYPNGEDVRVGDVVSMGTSHRGKVVACMYRDEYSASHHREQLGYLKSGVMIDTSFGGLVHYPDQASLEAEQVSLISRGS